MKRKITALRTAAGFITATLAIFALTACSAGESSAGGIAAPASAESFDATRNQAYDEAIDWDYYVEAEAPMMAEESLAMSAASDGAAPYPSNSGGTGITAVTAPVTENLAEKIIYSYWADIETLEFDNTIAEVERLISLHGAFIENSSVSGVNYEAQRWGSQYRYAYFQIRVPVEQLNAITSKLSTLGNVLNQSSNATNITAQFTDTESRLNSLRIQEERLLDMLSRADEVSDMIEIENSLSNVRYQIESLTSTLTNWQRQVDYSTLTLNIAEVEAFQEPPPPVNRTYWERMGDGIATTMRSIGEFFMNLFMWIMVNAPVLLILTIIVVIIYLIVRRSIRKSRARQAERLKNNPHPNMPYGNYYNAQPAQQPEPNNETPPTDEK